MSARVDQNAASARPPRRGPMGHGPRAMMPGEKAADFKGTMKKLLSLRYLLHGRCIIMAAMTGMTASANTSYRSAEDITAEYERSPTSFAFGFMRVRMLSSFL